MTAKLTSVRIDNFRIAAPQEGDEGPEVVADLSFGYDTATGGPFGPCIRTTVFFPYHEQQPVPALIDAALAESLRLLGSLVSADRQALRAMIDAEIAGSDQT